MTAPKEDNAARWYTEASLTYAMKAKLRNPACIIAFAALMSRAHQ